MHQQVSKQSDRGPAKMGEGEGGSSGGERPAWVKGPAACLPVQGSRGRRPAEGVQPRRSLAGGRALLGEGPAGKRGQQGRGLWGWGPGERCWGPARWGAGWGYLEEAGGGARPGAGRG